MEIVKFANGAYGIRKNVSFWPWCKSYEYFRVNVNYRHSFTSKSNKNFQEECMSNSLVDVQKRLDIINMTEEVVK